MSLILEALKKSEARRRLGNAPDLGTPFATAKPRRGLLPYLVIAIAIAGGIGWWMLHKSPAPAASATNKTPVGYAPTQKPTPAIPQHSISGAANDSGNSANSTSQEPAIWVAAQRPSARPGRHEGRPAREARRLARNESSSAYASAPTMGQTPSATAHTPVASAAQPTPTAPQSSSQWVASAGPNHPMPKRHSAIAAPATVAGNASATAQSMTTHPVDTPRNTPAPALHPRDNPAQPDPTRVVASPGTAPTKPELPVEAATAPTDVPPYYQLAFDVRKALPPLKLSMHVYSADPATRFVILNDSRMTEGEKTPDDVTLEKIVPDGVILEFEGHRFFYPRDAL